MQHFAMILIRYTTEHCLHLGGSIPLLYNKTTPLHIVRLSRSPGLQWVERLRQVAVLCEWTGTVSVP